MSKNINVNPDHYKVAGRERQGEDIVQKRHKTRYANAQHELDERAQQRSESLRGMAERATAPGGEGEQMTREATRPARSRSGVQQGDETGGARRSGATKGRAGSKRKAASKGPKKAAGKKSAAKRSAARTSKAKGSAAKKSKSKKRATKAPAKKSARKSASKRSAAAKRPARKK